ncbi:hypothetical protein [Corynebacterium sp. H78]|uniref:hypothetical protein n=1 Tax=Corynebacterium sp. H78 TaxID=3133417 RepID=UPI003095D9BD
MNNQVDFSSRPDYRDHLRTLGDSDLRFLLRASGSDHTAEQPRTRAESIMALLSDDAALNALSFATIDVVSVIQLVHVLEDSATLDDLAEVAYFASDDDTSPHEKGVVVSKRRERASKSELLNRLHRARNLGLVWEQPVGVWNVPPHVSRVFGEEPTMATPVQCLIDLVEPDLLRERMRRLGLLGGNENLQEHETLARLRDFLCSPRKVRALVSMAPLKVQKQLKYFAQEAIRLDRRTWSASRAEAVEWAEEHLLAVSFTTPMEYGDELNASMVSPVSLALRGSEWFIPRPHEREQFPAAEKDNFAAQQRPWQRAVSCASAYLQWAGTEVLCPFEMEGKQKIIDFAVTIGANPDVMTVVVDMLVCAGLVDEDTGGVTTDALSYWFSSTTVERWAWLVAGWLTGKSEEQIAKYWVGDSVLLAQVAARTQRRMHREIVMLAVELEQGHKYYRCCIDNHMVWQFQAAFDVLQVDLQSSIDSAMEGAEALGIFLDGEAPWHADAIAIALADAWFTEQDLAPKDVAELIASIVVVEGPQSQGSIVLSEPHRDDDGKAPMLYAHSFGVPTNDVAAALDFLAERDKTGAVTRWVFTEDSVRAALIQVDWDVERLYQQLVHVANTESMRPLFEEHLMKMVHSLQLQEILELPMPVSGATAGSDEVIDGDGSTNSTGSADGIVNADDTGETDPTNDKTSSENTRGNDGDDSGGEPEQLSLF